MTTYNVTMPLVGSITFYGVEADSESEAITATYGADLRFSVENRGGQPVVAVELNEVEWLEAINNGNVQMYSSPSRATVESSGNLEGE